MLVSLASKNPVLFRAGVYTLSGIIIGLTFLLTFGFSIGPATAYVIVVVVFVLYMEYTWRKLGLDVEFPSKAHRG